MAAKVMISFPDEVLIMEENARAAIGNNVLGTRNLIQAAGPGLRVPPTRGTRLISEPQEGHPGS